MKRNWLQANVNLLRESPVNGWEELSAEDIIHYGKVVSALEETIRIMCEVDEVIEVNGGWPIK